MIPDDWVFTEPAFRTGLAASNRAEFRASDVNGRPIDVRAEGDTARAERIFALQDRWTERQLPSAEPIDVIHEWMGLSPDNRMSAFARNLAEHPERLPEAESEPMDGQAPRPGGLVEQMRQTRRARGSVM